MKKLIPVFVIASLFSLAVAAQERAHCFTSEIYNEQIKSDPQYEKNQQDLQLLNERINNGQARLSAPPGGVYIIPVVFHVLHNYGPENVSDDVIREAVRLMNLDFRRLNADTANTLAQFRPIAADCEIEFRLATIDPFGNCTNGIEHIATTETYSANDSSKINPNWPQWPCNKYMNIWVAHSLQNTNAAAYAHLPGGPNNTDGIMCWYTYVNNIQHTLTHEMGHCFNLLHVWGNNNSPGQYDTMGNPICGDDFVNDTPISWGWDHCNLNGAVCDTSILENVQNFMEYSYCDNMFTQGQKTRMHITLNNTLNGRNNLWTNSNLIATGTDGTPGQVCVPKADFKTSAIAACANSAVIFTDQSSNAEITSWNWSFPGGTPATSTDSNPLVTYANAGIYDVTLVASSSAGSDTVTKSQLVRVSGPTTTVMPYSEDFEDTSSFPGADGWVENPDGNTAWTRVGNASASTGTYSLRMNNYNTAAGAIDEWITPSIDFSNVGFPVYVTFKVANAQRSSTSNDQLNLFYSINCGSVWSGTTYHKGGSALATAGISGGNFTPTSSSQWRYETVTVNGVANKPNARFKFQNISDHGNNTYIDDIFITGNITSIDEEDELQGGFAMYPNPTSGSTTVSFGLINSSRVIVEVKNMVGQTIAVLSDENLSSGMHEVIVPALAKGIYLVDITVNNKHHIRKLVVS